MDTSVLTTPCSECNTFVSRNARGRMCHTLSWSDMINEAFGHKTFYLVAREDGNVHGVLPLTQVRSRLFGNRLVSQAFSNYGGPLTDGPSATDALYNRAIEIAIECGCESLEFRNVEALPYDLKSREDKISMWLQLGPDPDEVWHSFNCKVRNQVRKAEKSGLVTTCGQQDLLADFWRIWTIRMRQLGTPCYSSNFFKMIFERFPANTRVFLVRLDGETVAAALVYCFNGFVQIRWAATLIQYNKLCPNNLLYWSIIEHYCLAGASCFDFGRSTVDSSHHRFKKQWNAYPVQLHYQYWARPGHEFSIVKPDNPKYSTKIKVWKRLPISLTRLIGPRISCNLP